MPSLKGTYYIVVLPGPGLRLNVNLNVVGFDLSLNRVRLLARGRRVAICRVLLDLI